MRNNKGYALIATLFALLLLLPLAVAMFQIGMYQTRQSAENSWKKRTFYAADGMVDWTLANLPEEIAIGDSVYIAQFPIDYKVIGESWVRRIDTDTTDQFRAFIVTGRGRTPIGTETTISLNTAVRGRPIWNVPAAFGAMAGVHKNGTSGIITGQSVCPEGETSYGILAPTGEVDQNGVPVDGTEPWLDGDPPIVYSDDIINDAQFENWEDIRDGDVDYEASSITDWPDSTAFSLGWPIVRWTGPLSTTVDDAFNGRGILIVPQDLKFGGGFTWEGIVLVGGRLISSGETNVYGSVWSGLNVTLGEYVDESDLGNGTIHFQYDLCNVRAALRSLEPVLDNTDWRELGGGWTEF